MVLPLTVGNPRSAIHDLAVCRGSTLARAASAQIESMEASLSILQSVPRALVAVLKGKGEGTLSPLLVVVLAVG